MSKEERKNRRGEGKAKKKGNLFKRDTKTERPNIFEEIIEYYFYFYVLFKLLFII